MTPTNEKTYSAVTRKVFDLNAFDDVQLSKPFVAPARPTSIEQALAVVGNDAEKLISLVYEGMVSEARESQYNDLAGFLVVGEDGKPTETVYEGKPVTEEQGKLINAAVLNMAKMLSGGAWDTLGKEKKAALKEQAIGFIRSNPAMISSIQGS